MFKFEMRIQEYKFEVPIERVAMELVELNVQNEGKKKWKAAFLVQLTTYQTKYW